MNERCVVCNECPTMRSGSLPQCFLLFGRCARRTLDIVLLGDLLARPLEAAREGFRVEVGAAAQLHAGKQALQLVRDVLLPGKGGREECAGKRKKHQDRKNIEDRPYVRALSLERQENRHGGMYFVTPEFWVRCALKYPGGRGRGGGLPTLAAARRLRQASDGSGTAWSGIRAS